MRKSVTALTIASVVIAAFAIFMTPRSDSVHAQTSKSKFGKSKSKSTKTPNTKLIDVKAQRAEQIFMREAADLARAYENAGHLERSKQMLQNILKLNPSVPGVAAKIKQLDETILSSNEVEFEVDTGKGWGSPRARVAKGKRFRIEAEGVYQFVTSVPVSPLGFPTEDPTKQMAAGIPCGALMGLILSPSSSNSKKQKQNPPKPFVIGAGKEITPREDGILFLSVNAPPGHKCMGEIQVRMSGYLAAP